MFTVKNIEPGILEVQQKIMGWKGTKTDTFYKVKVDGKWFQINNDRLETARHAVAGKLTNLEVHYVSEMTGKSLEWFKKYTLPKLEGEFN